MAHFVAHNLTTKETIKLSRDPSVTHPDWVHEQFDTLSEHNLQAFLDECERVWPEDETGVDEFGLEFVR